MIDNVILSLVSFFAAVLPGVKWISWKHFHENLGCLLRNHDRKPAKRFASVIVVLTGNDRLQYLDPSSKIQGVQITNEVSSPMKYVCNDSCRKIPNALFLLSIRRLDYQKGFERIPALFAKILKRHPEWNWEIAGDGIFWKRIQVKIEASSVKDSLLLSGRNNSFPYYHYRKASPFVMTPRYEGFGLLPLEALPEKCPLIAFNCRFGPSDIIAEGKNGLLIPAKDFSALETGTHKLIENELLCAHFVSILAEVSGNRCIFSERSTMKIAKHDPKLLHLAVRYFRYAAMAVLINGAFRFMCQKMRMPSERILTITNACEKTVLCLMKRLQGQPYLPAFGRLAPVKGLNHQIRLFAETTKLHPEEHLVICRDGSNRDNLETLAGLLNLSCKIHFQEGMLESCNMIPICRRTVLHLAL